MFDTCCARSVRGLTATRIFPSLVASRARIRDHRVDTFRCGVHGCTHALASLAAFESHYAAHHRHACRTCGACFASGRWLELHLAERHDSMFRLLAERRKMVRRKCVGALARSHSVLPETKYRAVHSNVEHAVDCCTKFHVSKNCQCIWSAHIILESSILYSSPAVRVPGRRLRSQVSQPSRAQTALG